MMNLIRPKEYILEAPAYIPGKHGDDADKPLILSANENPLGPPPKTHELLKFIDMHRYPDGSCYHLRAALAEKHCLNIDNIVIGAGSDELITLLIRLLCTQGDEILYSQYGFLMYMISAKSVGAIATSITEVNRKTCVEGMIHACKEQTKAIFIANPNNPTGSYINKDELRFLCEQVPRDILIVVDQAYVEYADADDYIDAKDLINEFDHLCVIQTFSKIYGLAALRLGWGVFPDNICDALNRIRSPFNVAQISQDAGLIALEDNDYVKQAIFINKESYHKICEICEQYPINVLPSQGNFVLLECGHIDNAKMLYNELEKRHILLRAMGSYGLPTTLRLTLGTSDDMQRVENAFADIFADISPSHWL